MEIMGVIRLAPGEVGFYDPLTRIHLTLSKPQTPVLAGMNTKNLMRSVKSRRLILVSGSLEPGAGIKKPVAPAPVDTRQVAAQLVVQPSATTVPEPAKVEPPVVQEPPAAQPPVEDPATAGATIPEQPQVQIDVVNEANEDNKTAEQGSEQETDATNVDTVTETNDAVETDAEAVPVVNDGPEGGSKRGRKSAKSE